MNELTYKSVERDGIEFYVSLTGTKTGMSMRGLTRCCGIARSTLQGVLDSVVAGSTTIKSLQNIDSNEVFIDLGVAGSENNAKIVSSTVCAKLIQYYAYESKNAANEIAKRTLSKFAIIGIDNWIKKITGFDNTSDMVESKIDQILAILIPQAEEIKQIKAELEEMQPVVEEYTNVKHGIRTTFRGLETVIEHVKHEQYVLSTGNTYTLSEWLDIKGITLSHSGLRKLGRTVAESFKTCTVAKPKKKNYLKPNGKWSCNCTAYSEEHFPLLEMALNQFVQN